MDAKILAMKSKNPKLFSPNQKDTDLDKELNFHINEKDEVEFENPLILHIDKHILFAEDQRL